MDWWKKRWKISSQAHDLAVIGGRLAIVRQQRFDLAPRRDRFAVHLL
jgi:hypothetical protein